MVAEHLFVFHYRSARLKGWVLVGQKLRDRILSIAGRIEALGVSKCMDFFEKKRLRIFNLLVFFQLLSIIILPVQAMFNPIRSIISIEMFLPAFVNFLVLWLNDRQKLDAARVVYFMISPIITGIIYIRGVNLGAELNFILYGVLAVFFIAHVGQMIFCVGLSMLSYYMLSFLATNYQFELRQTSFSLYLFNQAIILIFIFYALYLIKIEHSNYQRNLVIKAKVLLQKNQKIRKQRKEISRKAGLLESQAMELRQLNGIKDKLFSVIAHDMKTPIYALKNLFQHIQKSDLPAEEIKMLVPEIVNDLNITAELMENLLHWSKSQMRQAKTSPKLLELSELTETVLQILRLPANTKQICLENCMNNGIYVLADPDMIQLVLRNLVSNAIKFTPMEGRVRIGATELKSRIEVFVEDNGNGISGEMLKRIKQNQFFSTRGTSNEAGTGIGLMLCKEFISRHGGEMQIESKPGSGSIFRFTLPKAI